MELETTTFSINLLKKTFQCFFKEQKDPQCLILYKYLDIYTNIYTLCSLLTSSITLVSPDILFKILPSGVVSKNLTESDKIKRI